ncbi:hypothetical protein BOH72_14010 [Mycobacterium sp. WY10]|nr:hypothetical protein BOH72_14010 [Mycobacterium sp. WY10]
MDDRDIEAFRWGIDVMTAWQSNDPTLTQSRILSYATEAPDGALMLIGGLVGVAGKAIKELAEVTGKSTSEVMQILGGWVNE